VQLILQAFYANVICKNIFYKIATKNVMFDKLIKAVKLYILCKNKIFETAECTSENNFDNIITKSNIII